MKRVCAVCGVVFENEKGNAKYCSQKCARIMSNKKDSERYKKIKAEEKIKAERSQTDWSAIVKKCNKLNISYGQAVTQGLI